MGPAFLIVAFSLLHAEPALADSDCKPEELGEVIRTLVGSIGLVAAVPITTGLAALVVTGTGIRRRRPDRGAQGGAREVPPVDADWERFTPTGEDF